MKLLILLTLFIVLVFAANNDPPRRRRSLSRSPPRDNPPPPLPESPSSSQESAVYQGPSPGLAHLNALTLNANANAPGPSAPLLGRLRVPLRPPRFPVIVAGNQDNQDQLEDLLRQEGVFNQPMFGNDGPQQNIPPPRINRRLYIDPSVQEGEPSTPPGQRIPEPGSPPPRPFKRQRTERRDGI